MSARAFQNERSSVALAALSRNWNLPTAGEVGRCEAFDGYSVLRRDTIYPVHAPVCQRFGRPGAQNIAAVFTRSGAEVHHEIGRLNHITVVLHDKDGVPQVAEIGQRLDELVVVARMEADGGLVEHIEHAGQLGADLRGEADALAFPA